MRPRRMLKREMEELSIRRVPGRDAAMQRKLVVLSDKRIVHVNGQTLGERALERLKLAVQCMVTEGQRGREMSSLTTSILRQFCALAEKAYFWLR